MLPLMMPSLRLRSRRPLRVRLPTYSTAPTMFSANWNSGPKLNCWTIGVSWFGSWMRHCTIVGFTVCGVERREALRERERRRIGGGVGGDRRIHQLRQVQSELALAAVAIELLIEDAVAAADHDARSIALQVTPTRGAMSSRSGWINARSKTLPSFAVNVRPVAGSMLVSRLLRSSSGVNIS